MVVEADSQSAISALLVVLSGVEDSLKPIVARAIDWHTGTLSDVYVEVAKPVGRAIAAHDLNLPGEDVDGPIDWTGVDRILAEVDSGLVDAETSLNTAVQRATDTLGSQIESMMPTGTDVIGRLAGILGDLVSGLLGNLTETPDFWETAFASLARFLVEDTHPLGDAIVDVVKSTWHEAGDILTKSANGYAIIGHGVMTGNDVTPLNPDALAARMAAWPDWLKSLVDVALEFVSAYGILSALADPKVSEATQGARKNNPIEPLSVANLLVAVRRGIVGEDWAKDHAKRTGYSPELFDIAMRVSSTLLPVQSYVELWRRSQDDSVLDNLRKLGLGDEDISALRVLAYALPTPSDLTRFMARDVYDDDAVTSGGLDTDFEKKTDKAPWKEIGIDITTLRQYWRAHWSMPSPSMYYEMFHRGLIDEAALTEALKISDYAPGWIPRMVAINYNVPGRIDVRRMFQTGVISTHEDLVKRHKDMGYSPADSETLAQFVEATSRKASDTETERLHNPIAVEIIKSYATGGLSYDDARAYLTGLGYSDEMAVFRLQLGIFQRERDKAGRIRASIGKEYVAGYLDESEARSRLQDHGFEPNEQDSLLESWNLDRELREASEELKHAKDLTKSEVLESYRDRIIARGSAEQALEDLGYDATESGTLLQLEDLRQQKADSKVTEASVRTQLVARLITSQQASDALAGFGYTSQRIAALMSRWEVEREERRPHLSTGQVESILKQGIVPQDRAEAMLEEHGYTPANAALLMTLWGSEMATADDVLAERKREFDQREARLADANAKALAARRDALQQQRDLTTNRERAVQTRFDTATAQRADLQTQRLQATTASQVASIAANTARDAANFDRRVTLQANQNEAARARLETSIKAQSDRQAEALAARQDLADQQAALRQKAIDAADQRQVATLQAAADRLNTQISAADARANAAAELRQSLQDQHDSLALTIQDLRTKAQAARDIRSNADKIATETRNEQASIRKETRTQARADITRSQAASTAEQLTSLKLNRDAATSALQAQLAALEAQAADQRQQDALARKLAAESALAAASRVTTLLESNV